MSPDVRRPVDRLLLLFALLLMAIGMVWVYSASAFKNPSTSGSFLVRQLAGGVIGLILMLALSQVDLTQLRDNAKPLKWVFCMLVVLLASTFFFPAVNGAHRWIRLPGVQVQPSELFKPLSVLITGWWMVHHRDVWQRRAEALPKLITLMGILAIPLGLMLAEPDFGTTFLIMFVVMLVIFLGGAPKWIFALAIPALVAVGTAFILISPYRMARVVSFLNPEATAQGKGYQATQSLIALGNGGIFGVGIGESLQKLHYLPEAHNDFIYAVIGEEVGLVGTLVVLFLFAGILWRGLRIARRVRDRYLRLCASGFTMLLVTQAFMNMSVVISIVPNKGIPLPFISYGSSNLVANLITLGLLLAISKEASEPTYERVIK